MSSFPRRVRIREVGPRDGFQNEPEVIPTAEKVRLIELLGRSGMRRIEVTSFVRADVIPQLCRRRAGARDGPPTAGGRGQRPDPERARSGAGARAPRALSGDQRLPVRLRDPQSKERGPVDRGVARRAGAHVRSARAERLRCEGVISVSFGCPYEGHVPPERVFGSPRGSWRRDAPRSASATRRGWPTRVQVREFFRWPPRSSRVSS